MSELRHEGPVADATTVAVQPPEVQQERHWLLKPVNLFLLLCALLPLVFVIAFVTQRGVDMPLMDDWENASIIAVKTADGTLTLSDLFRQYVSHRMVFTNLYTAIMTVLAQWPIKFTLYFIVFQATLCLAMLGALLAKDAPRSVPVVLVAFSVLMFSVRQNINWLLSTQTSWFFVLLFFLAAMVVLRFMRPGWRPVILAAVLSVCGVFSTLHGFAGLAVLFVYMGLLGYRQPKYFIFWIVITLASAALFLSGYNLTAGAPEDMASGIAGAPWRIPLYLITYLGNPFVIVDGNFWPLAAAIGVTGILLLIVNAAFLFRRFGSIRPIATWIIISLWAVTSGFLTSIGRGHYFPEPNPRHPLLDRYVLPSTFLWFGVIVLVVLALREINRSHGSAGRTLLTVINVGVMVILVGLFGWTTHWSYNLPPFLNETNLTCMQRFPATRNIGCLTSSLLDTISRDELLDTLNGMAIHQLAGFRDIPPQYTAYLRLDAMPRNTDAELVGTRFGYFSFEDGLMRPVFLQPTPSRSIFSLTIPDTDKPIVFFSAAYVDITVDGTQPDGAIFRVAIRPENGEAQLLQEIEFDPQTNNQLRRISLRLDAYRGQNVELALITDDRLDPTADNAMWIDPGVLVLPAEPVED
jgi:hypothetical protein